MQPTTKEDWINYLAGVEKLRLQREQELKQCIAEGKSDRSIEQASAAIIHCAQRIEFAKKAIAEFD
jgi:hypothetical protein